MALEGRLLGLLCDAFYVELLLLYSFSFWLAIAFKFKIIKFSFHIFKATLRQKQTFQGRAWNSKSWLLTSRSDASDSGRRNPDKFSIALSGTAEWAASFAFFHRFAILIL
jgi:hypothetical protein